MIKVDTQTHKGACDANMPFEGLPRGIRSLSASISCVTTTTTTICGGGSCEVRLDITKRLLHNQSAVSIHTRQHSLSLKTVPNPEKHSPSRQLSSWPCRKHCHEPQHSPCHEPSALGLPSCGYSCQWAVRVGAKSSSASRRYCGEGAQR